MLKSLPLLTKALARLHSVGSLNRSHYFTAEGGAAKYWPHDGLVSVASAHAVDVPATVLPNRTTFTFHRTHSIFISDAIGAEWDTAMTWDTEVLDVTLLQTRPKFDGPPVLITQAAKP